MWAICFFFQAEDGIRDYKVTGVQTCALPISRLEKLGRRTFLQGLGTELDRVQRLRELALWLHGATGRGDPRQLAEAAELCKTDLTTGMVGEFPELQGTMGRVYALQSGVEPAVADAIFE